VEEKMAKGKGGTVVRETNEKERKKGPPTSRAKQRRIEVQQAQEKKNKENPGAKPWKLAKLARKERRMEQGYPTRHAAGTCSCKKRKVEA
jgi:hypothetical protein